MIEYSKLKALYDSARNKNSGKPIGNNLRVVKTLSGYGIKHHRTVIIDVCLNVFGEAVYTLNNGGWYSITTKKHLNTYSPANVYQRNGEWYCNGGRKYENGMKFKANGELFTFTNEVSRPRLSGDLELSEI